MNQVISLKKDIIIRVLITFFVLAVVSLFVAPDPKPMIYGLFFGTSIGLLNFLELASTLQKVSTMPPGTAQRIATTRYFIRYAVVAIVLYISITAPYLNIFGTAIGLLLVKFVIIIGNYIEGKIAKTRKKNPN